MSIKKISILFALLSIILTVGLVLVINKSYSQEPEEAITYEYVTNCPIDVANEIDSTFLMNQDFTEMSREDYQGYITSFEFESRNAVTASMASYYNEAYSTTISNPLDSSTIEEILANQDPSPLLHSTATLDEQLKLMNEMNKCISYKLAIAITVEKALINSWYQAYTTGAILDTMTILQENLNYFRTELLAEEVKATGEQRSAGPHKTHS